MTVMMDQESARRGECSMIETPAQAMRRRDAVSRRRFLQTGAASIAATALPQMLPTLHADPDAAAGLRGRAEHCIFVWLGGGACHIDTWDPKRLGDAQKKTPGSYYPAVPTAIPGVEVCEHLKQCAEVLDRCVPVRSVHHEVINEHAAATNRVHTGRPTSGTIVYPSLGSVVSHQRGPAGQNVPTYVLIGYPNVTRGPGFLGAAHNYVYLIDTDSGPAGFQQPADVSPARRARQRRLLDTLRGEYLGRHPGDVAVRDYDETIQSALRLSGPEFQRLFELDRESPDLRNAYGGEFGQRCLLARRLVQAGVRFVEVSHNLNFVNGTGWDTHNDGQLNQHLLIQELDSALATLIRDLERQRLLDKTLVVVASEFGRPAQFDGGGGRGHHADAFTVLLAGGSLRTGRVVGQTDELGMKIVDRPVSIPDLHATVYAALQIDPSAELYAGERPVPITDGGQPIHELFSA